MKTEKLMTFLEEMNEAIKKEFNLDYWREKQKDIWKILHEIYHFSMNIEKNGDVEIYYSNNIISIDYVGKEDDIIYVFVVMLLYTNISYRIEYACKKIKDKELRKTLRSWKNKLARLIRKLSIQDIRPIENPDILLLKWKGIVETAREKRLHHLVDHIRKITDKKIPKEEISLKKIRTAYEKIDFRTDCFVYYDYATQFYRTIKYTDTEAFYAILNLFAKSYTDTILWLRKHVPSGQWCPYTPWQVIIDYRCFIQKEFLIIIYGKEGVLE